MDKRSVVKPEKESDLFNKCLNVMASLLKAEGEDALQRAFSYTVYDTVEERLAKRWGEYTGKEFDEFIGEKRPTRKHWEDHPNSRMKDGEEIFIGEPYHLDTEDLKEIINECETHNLRCEIRTDGAWFPRQTLSIKVWKE